MPDITPEQREAAEAVMAIARAMAENAIRCAKGDPATGPATAALDAVLALGFRAPGPPTEEEVERAARAIVTRAGIDPDKPVVLVQAQPAGGSVRIVKGPFWKEREPLARAALTAALGRPE